MDFSKAFDVVPHQKLLHKIDYYGIRGKTKQWISSFLTNRLQRVVVNGEFSTWHKVLSGVPQGTVLGPHLFLLFFNDIYNVGHPGGVTRLFADDCLIYRNIVSESDESLLQAKTSIILLNGPLAGECGLILLNVKRCDCLVSVTR